MKKQIKVEIEVIDDEHCSYDCRFYEPDTIETVAYCIAKELQNLTFDFDKEQFLRSDKCKQAEVK